MPHPHNANSIRTVLSNILDDWEIPLEKVKVIVTDNGSNMVKAFHQDALELEGSPSGETDMDDLIKDVDEEARECEDIEEVEEQMDDEITNDVDFELCEKDHDMTFNDFGKRGSCFSHTSQLVVNKFTSVRS